MFKTDDFATCCGDVRELLYHEGNLSEHTFSVCKAVVYEDAEHRSRITDNWVYMLIVKGDNYPIIITEECAKSILENPEKGKTLAYNLHFDRYR